MYRSLMANYFLVFSTVKFLSFWWGVVAVLHLSGWCLELNLLDKVWSLLLITLFFKRIVSYLGQRKHRLKVESFDLLLDICYDSIYNVVLDVQVTVLCQILFKKFNNFIVFVCELNIFSNFFIGWLYVCNFLSCVWVIFHKGIVLVIPNFHRYLTARKFWQLNRFLEEPNPSLLKANSSYSFVSNWLNFYLFASHTWLFEWFYVFLWLN